MIALIVVTVLLRGVPIATSQPAYLSGNVVLAPLDPVIDRIAQSVESGSQAIVIRRGDRAVRVTLGKDSFERDGTVYVPLRLVVDGLGGSVRYDALRRTATIDMPQPGVLSTPTPFDRTVPTVAPTAVFTAQPTVTPRPTPSGIPRPRRTPIPAAPSHPGSS